MSINAPQVKSLDNLDTTSAATNETLQSETSRQYITSRRFKKLALIAALVACTATIAVAIGLAMWTRSTAVAASATADRHDPNNDMFGMKAFAQIASNVTVQSM